MKLEFRRVSKTFHTPRGPVAAVRDAGLSVADGELFVLLGPSGCGKSTLLSLAAGLERPDSGEILFDDSPVASTVLKTFLPPKARNVAMVFQSYALYPHLNVFENIAFPLRVAGAGKEEIGAEVAGAAGLLGIGDLLRARPGELSGGQRQRVAIARAIVRKPRLMLFDEPLSNLDAALRASTRAELKRLQRALAVTTLYVTHDQTEAMTLGDRIALMRDGRILQTGTPRELYENPETRFAASFVGPAPMNLADATAVEERGRLFLRIGGERIALLPAHAEQARRLGTDRLVFGIRPEHVRITTESAGSTLRGIVTSVENLGRERLVGVAIGEWALSALTAETAPKQGDRVGLDFVLEAARIFPRDEER